MKVFNLLNILNEDRDNIDKDVRLFLFQVPYTRKPRNLSDVDKEEVLASKIPKKVYSYLKDHTYHSSNVLHKESFSFHGEVPQFFLLVDPVEGEFIVSTEGYHYPRYMVRFKDDLKQIMNIPTHHSEKIK